MTTAQVRIAHMMTEGVTYSVAAEWVLRRLPHSLRRYYCITHAVELVSAGWI